jgi:signal peptidase II
VNKGRRAVLLLLILGLTVGCDQAIKRWAAEAPPARLGTSYLGGAIRLHYAENRGAFLSLGGALPARARFWLLTVGAGCLLAGIAAYALTAARLATGEVAGYALVAAGGLGNWADRLGDGVVVDFLSLGIGDWRTGVFNVADLAIVAGVALALGSAAIASTRPSPEKTNVS